MKEGLTEAIKLANYAKKNVGAYQKFLKNNNFKGTAVNNQSDFLTLPISEKKNYIQSFELFDFFKKETFPDIAYSSSGSSGQPTFWFRDKFSDLVGGKLHEHIFKNIFGIKKSEPTLVIICFSMGVWVAGSYTLSACRWVSQQGYKLTTITPGIEKADILHVLEKLAPKFQHVIIVGYPSFVITLLHETKLKKIALPKNLNLITSGDSFTENWRDNALKLIGGSAKPEKVISIYGSADAGAIAFETPATISLRKILLRHPKLSQSLFKNSEKQPAIFQYFPEQIYLENIGQELLLTTKNTIPLVRYNIHDIGNLMSYNEMKQSLQTEGYFNKDLEQKFKNYQLPFIIKYGRTDVAVTFYGLNLYPEHLQTGLKKHQDLGLISGNFRAYQQNSENYKQERLCLEVEVSEKTSLSKKILNEISEEVLKNLLKINTEFRKLHGSIGSLAIPKIALVKKLSNSSVLASQSIINLKGKKPRMEFGR